MNRQSILPFEITSANKHRRESIHAVVGNRRILLIADLPSIDDDFRRILCAQKTPTDLTDDEAVLFGQRSRAAVSFEVDSAHPGSEALEKVSAALLAGLPYSIAFVDLRAPPVWHGVDTSAQLWKADPRLQLVFCTAHSDTSWKDALTSLDVQDRLLILERPFDSIEVYQLAIALTAKWQVTEQVALKLRSLEYVVEQRTRELEQGREMFKLMAESTKAVPFALNLARGCFTYIGAQAVAESGIADVQWKRPGALDIILPHADNPEIRKHLDDCSGGPFEFVATLCWHDGQRREKRWIGTCESVAGAKVLRGLILDITEWRRLGRELAAAQKLESVGRLAAGVAHEINTPVQFVSDNVTFLQASTRDIATLVDTYRELQRAVQTSGDVRAAAKNAAEIENNIDLDYILENAPLAVTSALEGLDRIAAIVRSMKEFAHPDQAEKTAADINQAIQSTLIIAHNEYKFSADLKTHFDELPPIMCFLGEINQVILNLLVNAAHAIADVVQDSGVKGELTVRTRRDGDEVEISITDTGTGIPESVRDRIFDPFFTTKEVGKGTGQGLALAHSVVVQKHRGTLRFETECGKGTTFFIRLPINLPPNSRADQATAPIQASQR